MPAEELPPIMSKNIIRETAPSVLRSVLFLFVEEPKSACDILFYSAFLRILLVIALGIFSKRINGYNVDIKLRE